MAEVESPKFSSIANAAMGLAASFEATIKLRQQRADALLAGMSPTPQEHIDQIKSAVTSPDKLHDIMRGTSSVSIPSFQDGLVRNQSRD